jgi:hypothetical protein
MGIYFNTQFNQLYYAFLLTYLVSHRYRVKVRVMVFNATFNNISVISWWLVILVEDTRVPGEHHRLSQVSDKLYLNVVSSTRLTRALQCINVVWSKPLGNNHSMKSMSKFEPLDLHLFNLYLHFQLILHTVYNIVIAVAQNDCFKGWPQYTLEPLQCGYLNIYLA